VAVGACVGIGAIFGTHLWERFTRHITDREPYPEFLKGAN
jgi:hypothetical protein